MMDGNKEPIEKYDHETSGLSLFGVGGNKNKIQKDRTDIITRSSIEAIEKEEENGSDSLVTKPVLNINEKSVDEDDKDDNDQEDEVDNNKKVNDVVGDYYNDMPGLRVTTEPIVVHETSEYDFVFSNKMLGMDVAKERNKVWVSKVNM